MVAYKVTYSKQALKDAKKLSSASLDKKAKERTILLNGFLRMKIIINMVIGHAKDGIMDDMNSNNVILFFPLII